MLFAITFVIPLKTSLRTKATLMMKRPKVGDSF